MLFSYANFQRSQKRHCYHSILRHAFPGMFLKSFNKLAGRVLSGYKASCSFNKHYLNLLKFFGFFHSQGDSFPHSRSRVLASRYTYVSVTFSLVF